MYANLTIDDEIRITGQAIRSAGHRYEMTSEGGATVFYVMDDEGNPITDFSIYMAEGVPHFRAGGPRFPADDPRWTEVKRIVDDVYAALAAESSVIGGRREFWVSQGIEVAAAIGPMNLQTKAGRKKGMSTARQKRANLFKEIKDSNEDYTLQQVANAANDRDSELLASADMVKNDYRAMGWEWKRGERSR